MRWMTLLGRTGTVLIMVGLALVLVSLIPSYSPSRGWSRGSIASEEYEIKQSGVYAPQTGFQISVESTDNVEVYILGVRPVEFDNWKIELAEAYPGSELVRIDFLVMPMIFVREAYPDLHAPQMPGIIDTDGPQEPTIMDVMWDIAVLDKGLQTYPDIVLWKSPPGTTLSHEFFPPDVLYITVMVANRSPDTVEVETEITDLAALAPKERVVAAARLLIPIGVVLAIPWLVSKKVKRRTL
jgi:hypothetical protein